MKESLFIRVKSDRSLFLRSVEDRDREQLRVWKNQNRKAFFFQETITEVMQEEWFKSYLTDSDNFLFMVEKNRTPIGCVGFKLSREGADIYNCILGDERLKRHGIMSQALQMTCAFISTRSIKRIFLKVLKTNVAAQRWYLKNQFKKVSDHKQYDLLELAPNAFSGMKLEIQTGEVV